MFPTITSDFLSGLEYINFWGISSNHPARNYFYGSEKIEKYLYPGNKCNLDYVLIITYYGSISALYLPVFFELGFPW